MYAYMHAYELPHVHTHIIFVGHVQSEYFVSISWKRYEEFMVIDIAF